MKRIKRRFSRRTDIAVDSLSNMLSTVETVQCTVPLVQCMWILSKYLTLKKEEVKKGFICSHQYIC